MAIGEKKSWVAPNLRTLDVSRTLGGTVTGNEEFLFISAGGDPDSPAGQQLFPGLSQS